MSEELEGLTQRFDEALFVTMHNLGPQLIQRAQVELTPGQMFLLHHIQREHQCNLSQLAEQMEVSPSAITIMLDRLENHQLVRRIRDEHDRRVVNVQLTSKGENTLSAVLDIRKQILQCCLAQFPIDELHSFVHSLEKLAKVSIGVDPHSFICGENPLEG